MSEVLGFDWWNSHIPTHLREKVEGVQAKAGTQQVESHHPIEFTSFEDLIRIVTVKFQAWPDERTISASDLYQLLNVCDSVEDIRKGVDNRRKVVSFWDDVFSYYFGDKDAWTQLKKDVKKHVIPIRNKVMHHRLFRRYELVKLEQCRNEANRIIGVAKSELSHPDLSDAQQNISMFLQTLSSQLDPDFWKTLQEPLVAMSQLSEAIRRPVIDPEVLEIWRKPIVDPAIFQKLSAQLDLVFPKPLQETLIAISQLSEAIRRPLVDPEILEAWRTPLIDPANFQTSIPRIDLDLPHIPTPVSDPSTTQEEE